MKKNTKGTEKTRAVKESLNDKSKSKGRSNDKVMNPSSHVIKSSADRPVQKNVSVINTKSRKSNSLKKSPRLTITEDAINRIEEIFSPCRIRRNKNAILNTDLQIEIINPLSNSDKRLVSGKSFEVIYLFQTSKGNPNFETEWLGKIEHSTVPSMLILDVNGSSMYYLWLDQGFYTTLRINHQADWLLNESIEVPLKQFTTLSKRAVAKIENYLVTLSPDNSKSIKKGVFFDIRVQLKSEIEKFISYASEKQVDISKFQFTELLDKTINSIYTISIVGPSRAGKSTLINSLIKANISPVNVLPTTGVPFTIQYGKQEGAEIIFSNGEKKKGDATVRFLEKYIDQKHNPRNDKNVKFVTVSLDNENLEKGLAFCDVPGLDDVNEEIRRISRIAVYSSNAIIYLIDTSPYKYGGFSLNSHHLSDLRELAPRMDRLYLVFNKVDVLSDKDIRDLKAYISRVLNENDLLKLLPSEPLYISAKNSFDSKNKKNAHSPYGVEVLETTLWDNLLKTNKNGLYNLGGLVFGFKDELNKLKNILSAKLVDSDKGDHLKKDIENVREKLRKFSSVGETNRDKLLQWLEAYINQSVEQRLETLRTELERIPVSAALPNSLAIRQYLETNAVTILTQVFDEVGIKLDTLYSDLNYMVMQELSQIEIVKDENYSFLKDKSRMNSIIKPISDAFFQKNIPNTISILQGVASALEDAIVGIFGFLERLFMGKANVRSKQISQIVDRARNSYWKVFNGVNNEFSILVRHQYNAMIRQLKDRADVYVNDLNKQLNSIAPSNSMERNKIGAFLSEIDNFETRVERIRNEIMKYSGVDSQK